MTDLLEFLAARALAGGLARLPRRAGDRLGAGLAGLACRLGVRRDVVRRQVAEAFPGAGRARVERIVAGCYRHFGRELAEIVRLQRTGVAGLPDRTVTEAATEAWIDRMERGEGTLIVTGHLGNWEVAGAHLAARGVPLAAVVKRQSNPRFDAWLGATRRRLGIEPVYMDDAMRSVPRLLKTGRSVALVADQDARERGLTVTFLGRPASTFRGPARLALATDAPLVFGASVREGEGYRVTIDPVRDPAGEIDGDGGSGAELALTRAWVGRLELHVRRAPEQYFWFHRRWKSGRRVAESPGRNESPGDAVSNGAAREDGDDEATSRSVTNEDGVTNEGRADR